MERPETAAGVQHEAVTRFAGSLLQAGRGLGTGPAQHDRLQPQTGRSGLGQLRIVERLRAQPMIDDERSRLAAMRRCPISDEQGQSRAVGSAGKAYRETRIALEWPKSVEQMRELGGRDQFLSGSWRRPWHELPPA